MTGRRPGSAATWPVALAAVVTLTVLAVGNVRAQGGAPPRVDQTLTREADLTGDGKPERIALRLEGDSWQAPFRWSLSIASVGKIVFSRQSDDSPIDSLFSEKGFVDDKCDSYIACKRQYYLHDLLDNLIVKADWPADHHALVDDSSGSVRETLFEQLTGEYRITPGQVAAIVTAVKAKLRTKRAVLIYVPVSPVYSERPRVWIQAVGAFVTLYRW
jgi:hypothetical protein